MITNLDIFPSFYNGFTFTWEVPLTEPGPRPWSFVVEESETGLSDFRAISPTVVDMLSFTEEQGRKKFSKDADLFFRVIMTDADGSRSTSPVRTAMGDLPLQEFLYVAEIQRKELLQMCNMAGVALQFWRKRKEGTPCTNCLDPVTGEVVDPDCEVCLGTKFVTGYHGPYSGFGTFSVAQISKVQAEGGRGVDDDRRHAVRVIGRPLLVREDVIVDTKADRRYIVDQVEYLFQLRRIPVIQSLTVHEAEVDDIRYALGLSFIII